MPMAHLSQIASNELHGSFEPSIPLAVFSDLGYLRGMVDDNTKRINVRLPLELYKRLDGLAHDHRQSFNAEVVDRLAHSVETVPKAPMALQEPEAYDARLKPGQRNDQTKSSLSVAKRLDGMEALVNDLQATMKAILEKMPDK